MQGTKLPATLGFSPFSIFSAWLTRKSRKLNGEIRHLLFNSLSLETNEARPHDKHPYAWLWAGSEMIQLTELPNPDPLTGRPDHGGRDRHTCTAIRDVSKLKKILDESSCSRHSEKINL